MTVNAETVFSPAMGLGNGKGLSHSLILYYIIDQGGNGGMFHAERRGQFFKGNHRLPIVDADDLPIAGANRQAEPISRKLFRRKFTPRRNRDAALEKSVLTGGKSGVECHARKIVHLRIEHKRNFQLVLVSQIPLVRIGAERLRLPDVQERNALGNLDRIDLRRDRRTRAEVGSDNQSAASKRRVKTFEQNKFAFARQAEKSFLVYIGAIASVREGIGCFNGTASDELIH